MSDTCSNQKFSSIWKSLGSELETPDPIEILRQEIRELKTILEAHLKPNIVCRGCLEIVCKPSCKYRILADLDKVAAEILEEACKKKSPDKQDTCQVRTPTVPVEFTTAFIDSNADQALLRKLFEV